MRIHEDLFRLLDEHTPFLRSLHARGSFAPVAVSIGTKGEVTGHALTTERPEDDVSVEYALDHFAHRFQLALRDEKIRAAAIFFHGCSVGDSIRPALTVDEVNTLVAWLDHVSGQSFQALIPYASLDSGKWRIMTR